MAWAGTLGALFLLAQSGEQLYRLEAGDEIEIKFLYNPELSDKITIRPDGRISMPMVGEITAAGMAVGELTNLIQDKYKSTVRQAVVTVQVRSFANRKVFVGGEVLRPGTVVLTGQQTVLGAILEAGGLMRTADRNQVTLIRRTAAGSPETRTLGLRAAKGKAAEAAGIAVQPYDMIVVTRSGIAKANQAVEQYIRNLSPALLTAGFTYLFNLDNGSNVAGGVIR